MLDPDVCVLRPADEDAVVSQLMMGTGDSVDQLSPCSALPRLRTRRHHHAAGTDGGIGDHVDDDPTRGPPSPFGCCGVEGVGEFRTEFVHRGRFQVRGAHPHRPVVGDLRTEFAVGGGQVGLTHEAVGNVDRVDASAKHCSRQPIYEPLEAFLQLASDLHPPDCMSRSRIRLGFAISRTGGGWYHFLRSGEWRNWQTRRIQVPVR